MFVTVLQAAAIISLWQARRFDTHDIALVTGIPEHVVCKVLDEVRRAEREQNLFVVGGR